MRLPLSWLTFPVLATLAACSGSDSEFTGDGGTPAWHADLLHEIGSTDDPGQTLTQVGEVWLTDGGLLLIEQGADLQIRVHGPDGAFLRMIGGAGEGPGEIERVSDFAVSGDTVRVVDGRNWRVTEFAVDGVLLGDERFEQVTVRDGQWVSVYLPSASPLPDGSSVSRPVMVGLPGSVAEMVMVVRRMTPDGTLTDTVLGASMSQYVETRDGQRSLVETRAILAEDRRGDGALLALRAPTGNPEPGTFRLIRVDAVGDTAFDRAFSFEPVPVPADSVERYLAEVPEERRAAVRRQRWAPEFRPPIEDLVQGSDGTIWLQREPVGDPVEWWAIDPVTGDHVGTLPVPRGSRIVESRGDDVVVVRTDEFDVEYAQRWRVVR